MDLKEKAFALAQLFEAGVLKGQIPDFYMGIVDRPFEITCALLDINRGEQGLCDYQPDQLVFGFGCNPRHLVIVATTTDGFHHVFYGEVITFPSIKTYCAFDWLDPLYFLGEIEADESDEVTSQKEDDFKFEHDCDYAVAVHKTDGRPHYMGEGYVEE